MAIYFSSKKIPALDGYSFKARSIILSIAISKLSVPQKLLLNIIKLSLLTPLFILAARMDGWNMAFPMVAIVVFYPLITNPLMLHLAQKHLDKAMIQYEKEQREEHQDAFSESIEAEQDTKTHTTDQRD